MTIMVSYAVICIHIMPLVVALYIMVRSVLSVTVSMKFVVDPMRKVT